jgi:hypothetical protein
MLFENMRQYMRQIYPGKETVHEGDITVANLLVNS